VCPLFTTTPKNCCNASSSTSSTSSPMWIRIRVSCNWQPSTKCRSSARSQWRPELKWRATWWKPVAGAGAVLHS
jgi:hypothetical protein